MLFRPHFFPPSFYTGAARACHQLFLSASIWNIWTTIIGSASCAGSWAIPLEYAVSHLHFSLHSDDVNVAAHQTQTFSCFPIFKTQRLGHFSFHLSVCATLQLVSWTWKPLRSLGSPVLGLAETRAHQLPTFYTRMLTALGLLATTRWSKQCLWRTLTLSEVTSVPRSDTVLVFLGGSNWTF